MARHRFQFLHVIEIFLAANHMDMALAVDHHHCRAVGNELHRLGDVIGAHRVQHHLVAGGEARQRRVLADDVDVHAQATEDCGRFRRIQARARGQDFGLVPGSGVEKVDPGIEDERVARVALGHGCRAGLAIGSHCGLRLRRCMALLDRDDCRNEIARVVHQRAARLKIEPRQIPAGGPQTDDRLADRFRITINRGGGLFRREILVVQARVRGEAAAEIEIANRPRADLLRLDGQLDEPPRRYAIVFRIEDEGAHVAVQALQTQIGQRGEAPDDLQCLAVVAIEAKLRPHRVRARLQMHAQRDRHRLRAVARDGGECQQLVEVIHLDHRAFVHRPFEVGALLVGAVEDDVRAVDAVVPRLFILEARDHLGNRAFLVKHAADRVEIIGLVRPGELHIRVPPAEGAVRFAIFFAHDFSENTNNGLP